MRIQKYNIAAVLLAVHAVPAHRRASAAVETAAAADRLARGLGELADAADRTLSALLALLFGPQGWRAAQAGWPRAAPRRLRRRSPCVQARLRPECLPICHESL